MRVATNYAYQTNVSTLQQRQEALQRTQEQMTSGKRIAKPSDDPAAMAVAERALQSQTRLEALQRAVGASRNAMTLTESAIGDASDLVQSARDTMLNAGNGSYSASDRQALAAQLTQIRGQLLAVANQSDGASGHLFGGQAAQTAPFVDGPTRVDCVATSGASSASLQDDLPLSVDGKGLWDAGLDTVTPGSNAGDAYIDAATISDPSQLSGGSYTISFTGSGAGASFSVIDEAGNAVNDASGNPLTGVAYTPGQTVGFDGVSLTLDGANPANGDHFTVNSRRSVFDGIDHMLAVLKDPAATNAQVSAAVKQGVSDLDRASARFQSVRAQVGATLNRLDTLEGRNADAILSAQTTRSNAEDLDMVQAVSDFSNKQTGYQAALQAYSMVQKLSLFNYINN